MHPVPRWLERMELFLRVVLWMYFGFIVCCTPWAGNISASLPWLLEWLFPAAHFLFKLWDLNPLWKVFPLLGVFAKSGIVRGIVSGVGLLNMWCALQTAARGSEG